MKSLFTLLIIIASIPFHSVRAQDNGAEFEIEAPPEARIVINERLRFGADIVGSLEHTNNLDLDGEEDDHLTFFEPEISAVLSYQASPRVHLYTELQFDGRAFLSKGEANDDKSEGHLRIEQLYADLPFIGANTTLRIGRQRFKDDRSWWFDEKIDAVQLKWQRDEWFVSASAAREKSFADDLVHEDTDEKVHFYILSAGRYAEKRNQTVVYIIKKKDLDSNDHEDPTFYGIQRIGEAGSDVRYWLNAALARGDADGKKVKAYGVDAGASFRFDSTWNPFITLAGAYGSGDNDLRDGEDGNFRQTDLQDNESRTYGITSYNYYGEVADLELSNLWIGTVGIGVRPDSRTSAELIYHYYRQVDLDDDLRDSDLESDPDGEHKELGHEVDFIVAHRPTKDSKITLTLGRFIPGDAYDSEADAAWLVKLKYAYRF